MINVAIVEDEVSFRKSLRQVIESKSGYSCVAECGTGAEALERIPQEPSAIVLMDLNLPDCTGPEAIARLKAVIPDIRVVVLTVYNDTEHIFKALQAGACGYLLKQASAGKIFEAIAEANRSDALLLSGLAHRVMATFQEQPPVNDAATKLSRREREILGLVADGYANKEIAGKLSITLSTVCWYLNEAYKKLHVQSRVQAINKLRQSSGGYLSS
jgi:DNA-binding NarL/FixJ family response regulator